jgi:endonuclease/exonuclease/phosphatase family metal-dependent hydrolase
MVSRGPKIDTLCGSSCCRLNGMYQIPWLVLGDFNKVQWEFEHFSVCRRPDRQMVDFHEIQAHCDLHDLVLSGLPWTYDNMQKSLRNVPVRLDRAVVTPEWTQLFPSTGVQHIVSSSFDHRPILLELDKGMRSKVRRIFRYEIMWEREESLHEEIGRA